MKWQDATTAPRDGRTLLFCHAGTEELIFARWQLNRWTQDERFTSTDPDGNFCIPTNELGEWLCLDGVPDPREQVK